MSGTEENQCKLKSTIVELQDRSMVIATYACCGFGSIAAVGVYMGAMISVAPDRRHDISKVALRACLNGNLAGFLTACIAGTSSY